MIASWWWWLHPWGVSKISSTLNACFPLCHVTFSGSNLPHLQALRSRHARAMAKRAEDEFFVVFGILGSGFLVETWGRPETKKKHPTPTKIGKDRQKQQFFSWKNKQIMYVSFSVVFYIAPTFSDGLSYCHFCCLFEGVNNSFIGFPGCSRYNH